MLTFKSFVFFKEENAHEFLGKDLHDVVYAQDEPKGNLKYASTSKIADIDDKHSVHKATAWKNDDDKYSKIHFFVRNKETRKIAGVATGLDNNKTYTYTIKGLASAGIGAPSKQDIQDHLKKEGGFSHVYEIDK